MAVKNRLRLAAACLLLAPALATAALAISNTQPLAFGKFVAGTGGTVSVSTNGTRTASGNVLLIPSSLGTAAKFTVSDADSANTAATYIINLPSNGVVVLTSGSNSMGVNNFVSNPSESGALTAGSQVLEVGAALSVGANQPAGNYSGSFTIIVNYQ